MRAMPYTPFTPCHCDKTDEPHYAEQGGLMRYVADNAAYSKHLTDAECAAELWREHALWTEAFMGRESPDPEVAAHSRSELPVVRDRSDTWHRFATHPHADEADQ